MPIEVDPYQKISQNGDNVFPIISDRGEAVFDQGDNADCRTDLADEDMLFAPEWSGNLNAQYIYPFDNGLELMTSVDMNYSDDYYSSQCLDPNTWHDDHVLTYFGLPQSPRSLALQARYRFQP